MRKAMRPAESKALLPVRLGTHFQQAGKKLLDSVESSMGVKAKVESKRITRP
jgi:hypothetical protein